MGPLALWLTARARCDILKTALDELRFIKRQDVESRRMRHVLDIERELAPLPEGGAV